MGAKGARSPHCPGDRPSHCTLSWAPRPVDESGRRHRIGKLGVVSSFVHDVPDAVYLCGDSMPTG
eukprot:4806666-Amphidinium_carterae.1